MFAASCLLLSLASVKRRATCSPRRRPLTRRLSARLLHSRCAASQARWPPACSGLGLCLCSSPAQPEASEFHLHLAWTSLDKAGEHAKHDQHMHHPTRPKQPPAPAQRLVGFGEVRLHVLELRLQLLRSGSRRLASLGFKRLPPNRPPLRAKTTCSIWPLQCVHVMSISAVT